MIFVANSFSLGMLPTNGEYHITVGGAIHPAEVADVLSAADGDWLSVVGHADTAAVMSAQLEMEVAHNRVNAHLQPGDVVFVAQLTGGRLPEGATELPEGVSLVWRRVAVTRRYDIEEADYEIV